MSEKLKQLQLIEQNIQQLNTQRQSFQAQLKEIENALREVKGTKEAYKIFGGVMIKTEEKKLTKELKEEEAVLKLRVKTLEDQEKKIQEKAKKIQTEVLKEMKND
jgi:prefoldin beta subunit